MTGAAYNRGNSEQTVGTPREFIDAVENRFGLIKADLACTRENCVCKYGSGIGPGFMAEDAFDVDWRVIPGNLWLNPPFGEIPDWSWKASTTVHRPGFLFMLVPASIGTNWYIENVENKSVVIGLHPRMKFVGHKDQYPKDLMLCVYGFGLHGHQTWRWK